jgi:hypothetical protein
MSHDPLAAFNAGTFTNLVPVNPAGSAAITASPTAEGVRGTATALRSIGGTFVAGTGAGDPGSALRLKRSVEFPPPVRTPLAFAPVLAEITSVSEAGGGSSMVTNGDTSNGPMAACAYAHRNHFAVRFRTICGVIPPTFAPPNVALKICTTMRRRLRSPPPIGSCARTAHFGLPGHF